MLYSLLIVMFSDGMKFFGYWSCWMYACLSVHVALCICIVYLRFFVHQVFCHITYISSSGMFRNVLLYLIFFFVCFDAFLSYHFFFILFSNIFLSSLTISLFKLLICFSFVTLLNCWETFLFFHNTWYLILS